MTRRPRLQRDQLRILEKNDIPRINTKIYLKFQLQKLGVSFDRFRLGRDQIQYENSMRAAWKIAQQEVQISACDFRDFSLDLLVSFAANRRKPCPDPLLYYHPSETEIQAFREFVHQDLGQLILSLPEPTNTAMPVHCTEMFLDYRTVLRKQNTCPH